MRKAKLIGEGATWQQVNYSRCGRTDKGVSAAGQVCRLLYSASCIHPRLYQLNTTLPFPCTSHPAPLISIASSCLCSNIDAVSAMLNQNGSCSIKITNFPHLYVLFCTCFHDDLQAARAGNQHTAVCLCLERAASVPIRSCRRHVCDAEAHALLLL